MSEFSSGHNVVGCGYSIEITRPSAIASFTRQAKSASPPKSRRSVPTGSPLCRKCANKSGSVPPALQITGVSAATAIGRADITSRVC
ncbi:hypothetical protein ALI144C_00375 [Actinosynnema sp. ALI-1.44]|uniref:hypothetical protein n=1 Tax=Actinosynnema sp. ALI-1.44 TaxID=1933779 RepID=UPI00097BD9CC|nr:hypothetical protein [Actinosynnema sp. ALI-1.44]ONI91875.1 hypothetical protein ALI144C_00375 [Actinosynnema sp. ALI-1.44]